MEQTREQLIDRARDLKREIDLHFASVAHWNRAVRRPDEARIDPDPDGKLQLIARSLDRTINGEGAGEPDQVCENCMSVITEDDERHVTDDDVTLCGTCWKELLPAMTSEVE